MVIALWYILRLLWIIAKPKYFSYLQHLDYRQFLEIRADKRFGKPCIKGTRISVYDVLNWLSNGMSGENIKSDFVVITGEMINACLAYAADKERRLISFA
ncbi:MAG: hypothetical protein ACJA08_000269 [Cyclobacteriaceae bacterium]